MDRSALALTALLALTACRIHVPASIEVDGVRLEHHHDETITLAAWPDEGLRIEARIGDVRIERGEGPTTLVVRVHERAPGEAHAHLAAGELVVRAAEGAPCALGQVLVRTSGPVRGLRAITGMGTLAVEDVAVEGDLFLETGMGDVALRGAGEPRSVELVTGMGDIEVTRVRCRSLRAETGMGDVTVHGLESEDATLDSGMGDIGIEHSRGQHLQANSGLGDVELVASSFTSRTLDTGLGRVRER